MISFRPTSARCPGKKPRFPTTRPIVIIFLSLAIHRPSDKAEAARCCVRVRTSLLLLRRLPIVRFAAVLAQEVLVMQRSRQRSCVLIECYGVKRHPGDG